MQSYIGTKVINAKPMTRAEYNLFRGWELPKDENGADAGYLVEYTDGGKANTSQYQGYVSWSPETVFNKAYKPNSGMSFSEALVYLKLNKKVAREGWNGKGMFVFLVPGSVFSVSRPPLLGIYPAGTEINYHGHIDMKTADGLIVPWLCSQTDMLAEDWCVVE